MQIQQNLMMWGGGDLKNVVTVHKLSNNHADTVVRR